MFEKRWLCWFVWKWYNRSIAFRIAVMHAQESMDKNLRGKGSPTHERKSDV